MACKRLKLSFFIFLLYTCSPFSIYAMAWLQPQGHGVLINTVSYYDSCSYWNTYGRLLSGPCFRQFTLNPYFEYGLFPRLTVGVNPFLRTFSQAGQTNPFSLNNSVFFARLQLEKSDWAVLSAQVGYNLPYIPASFGAATSTSSAYTISNIQSYTDFRLLYGVGGEKWYLDLETAYRNYYQGAASELHFDFVIGAKMYQGRFVTELQELNTVGLRNPSNPTDPNFSQYTLMPDIIYWITPKVALQLGVKQDFAGWNVGMGTEPLFALWYKF